MEPSRRFPPACLVAAASAWMATAGNAALWRELQGVAAAEGQRHWVVALALAGIVAAALYALLSLFAWRRLFKPAIVLLLVATAAGAHFMWTYHVAIDSSMAANTLQTDWHEVLALLTPRFALVVLVGAVVPAWLVGRVPVEHRPWKQQALRNLGGLAAGILLVLAIVMLGFQPLASTMRNHPKLRYLLNPLNQLWAAGQAAWGSSRIHGPLAPLGRDARIALVPGAKPRLLLLVLGETGRSGNFGINGYARDTTPELAAAQAVGFRNAWSCGTSTAASVPCMFSHLGRQGFLARTQESENLLDVLQHAGLAVLWIDNQAGGCKGVCDRVPNVNTAHGDDERLCPGGQCFDEVLLHGLDARLEQLPEARRRNGVVLVLHQMGSHGPAYAQRTPPAFKKFLPECTSSHLPDCSPQQLRNAYDNSIAYTDHVLGSAIAWLRHRADFDGALLHVADHGESLGENNLYLHGLPFAIAPDVQKHVPWITWVDAQFARDSGVTTDCLRARAGARITHDHLFHSVLGLMQVRTSAYRRELDAYAGCGAG